VSYIELWDSGQPNAYWDVGLDWDTSVGPSPGNVQPYINLITSKHIDKPLFIAMLSAIMQPFADLQVIMAGIPGLYDLDVAVGSQEDTTGLWIGANRNIAVPLTGVFFSWDVAGLGWGQGSWTPNINATELVVLSDAQFRTLLYATAAANQWDGTIPGAYTVWNTLFAGTGIGILIQDYGNMHMALALTGPVPDAVTLALFTNGYLNLKPAGVRIDSYYTPFLPDVPYFGWGVENANISGWDVGYWGYRYPGV
jgi:hypothetical protein